MAASPDVWKNGGAGEGFLYYPGPQGPIPSIRSERLRDGLEDYEYFRLIPRDEAGQPDPAFRPVLPSWNFAPTGPRRTPNPISAPRTFAYDLDPSSLDPLVEEVETTRIAIGRALGRAEKRGPE